MDLWVAKQHKLGERAGTRRMGDKDALDMLRLRRGTEIRILIFVHHGASGPEIAARAAAHVELPTVILASTTLLSQQLWEALREGL